MGTVSFSLNSLPLSLESHKQVQTISAETPPPNAGEICLVNDEIWSNKDSRQLLL